MEEIEESRQRLLSKQDNKLIQKLINESAAELQRNAQTFQNLTNGK